MQVDILRDTVMGALNSALPIGTKRTIYLCDDLPGKHSCESSKHRGKVLLTADRPDPLLRLSKLPDV